MRDRLAIALGPVLLLVAAVFLLWRPHSAPDDAVISANGVLDLHSPWSEAVENPREPRWTMNDPAMQMAPWRQLMRSEIRAGRIPFWNHLNGLGSPFLANPQTRCLYPPQWLFLLGPDAESAQALFLFFHVLLGGLGLFMLARRLGCGLAGATLAGGAFATLGYNPLWLLWPQHATLAWLPLLLLVADRLFERLSARRLLGVALVFCLMLLAGHPETAFKAGVALWLFSFGRLLERRRPGGLEIERPWRGVWGIGAGLVAGLFLAAPQVLPFLDYLVASEALATRSHEAAFPAHPDLMSFVRGVAAWGMQLLSPDVFGDGAGPGRFWFPEGNHSELASAYAGAMVLVLVPFGLAGSGRRRWSILLVLIFSLAVVLRLPGFYQALLRVPGFDVGANNRFIAIAGMMLALAAGFGLDRILRAEFDRDRLRGLGRLLPLGLFLVVSLALGLSSFKLEDEARLALRAEIFQRDGWLLASAFALVLGLLFLPRARPYLLLLVLGISLLDVELHSRPALSWCSRAELWPRTPVLDFLTAEALPERGRLLAIERGFGDLGAEADDRRKNFPAEMNIAYGIASLESYSALQPVTEARFSHLAHAPVTASGKMTLAWSSPGLFDDRLLDLAAVRWLLVPGDWSAQAALEPGTEIESADGRVHRHLYAGSDGLVLERPSAMPRAFLVHRTRSGELEDLTAPDFDPAREALAAIAPPLAGEGSGRAEILELRADRMEVEVEVEGDRALLVTSDLASDLWWVEVDGERAEIERCYGLFRGVLLERGRHRVVFATKALPAPFAVGLVLALLTALGLACLGLGARRRRTTA